MYLITTIHNACNMIRGYALNHTLRLHRIERKGCAKYYIPTNETLLVQLG